MYMKLREAVKYGYRLDGGTPFFFDHGEVVVYVEEKQVKGKGGLA